MDRHDLSRAAMCLYDYDRARRRRSPQGWQQYFNWIGVSWFFKPTDENRGLLQGSLGRSYRFNLPVSKMLASRLPATLTLNIVTLLFTWMLAIPLGTFAALKQYRLSDKA